jgi:hypothetical protein
VAVARVSWTLNKVNGPDGAFHTCRLPRGGRPEVNVPNGVPPKYHCPQAVGG